MSRILKPVSETGRTPGAKSRTSDKPWKKSERASAHWLVENDGPDLSPIMRSVQSRLKDGSVSGRVGMNTGLQFDLVSKNYVGENKRRTLPKWLWEAWVQIVQISTGHHKNLVLVLDMGDDQRDMVLNGKKVKVPELHCITPERHAYLLGCERFCEEHVSESGALK